jgi:vacuolar iron transporter family protein
MHAAAGHEPHPHRTFLSDFILGAQDGLVNVLGILLGLTAAAATFRIILIAALAALGAESVSMAAVAYTTTASRRKLYLGEEQRELREMKEVPETERREVRDVLVHWGYAGEKLERVLNDICENPKAMLEFMMAFELRIQPVGEEEARNSFTLVGGATVLGSFVPVIPYLVFYGNLVYAAVAAVVVSGAVLFLIGWLESKTTGSSLARSATQMVVIGLAAGFAGLLIGHFLGASPGV